MYFAFPQLSLCSKGGELFHPNLIYRKKNILLENFGQKSACVNNGKHPVSLGFVS